MALLSQWEGRERGVWGGGEGGAAGARREGGGREAGAGARGARAALTLPPPGRAAGAAGASGAGAAVGAAGGTREPGARAGGAQRGDAAERGRWLGGGRQTGVRAAGRPELRRLQARPRGQEPGAERGPRARNPVPAPPVLCLAAGCGDHGRAGPPEACVGPGRAGVGGGPPGPPMGSGCRCGGAMSRRRTPSWTPSSASLRARVSGGGGRRGGVAGGGPSSPECEWRGVPEAVCIGLVRVSGGCWPQAAGQGS